MIFKETPFIIYEKYDDRLLVNLANNGNVLAEHYLINRYKRLVKTKARAYFLIGADTEDIIQEGMIGLYKALQNYDNSKLTSFRVFAEICISRQIITAIKKASRKKHKPLNCCISLNQPIENVEYCDRTLIDIIDDLNISDPMNIFLSRERLQELKIILNNLLSNLERKVLEAYLDGKTYRDIALKLKKSSKCVDNAIQRIKKKIDLINK
ncbi:MAG: RNA polymerase sporulation sigma factor SigH [Atribacterota bacterium]|nr:RNA polymerase sporulation sigma factor SigH [Atribacterota bacterium]MDD4895990.1 RNA polymerase sporulation sigma factor SigH [Atribacterota bacterium]MDD5636447.1 RNA polymerase sporulation sigma factor SigH [Atribacterota bacterium]